MNSGRMATAARVSRHSRRSITARVAAAANELETSDTRVPVTADWAPTTSLLSRDIISPGRVAVKNASDIRCRWEYRSVRRSKMIPSPARAEAQRWATPTIPLTIGTATSASPSRVTRPRSSFGMAVSMRSRISSGGTSDTKVITTIVANTTSSSPRYGVAYPATRRSSWRSTRGRSCSSSYLMYDHQPPEWKMAALLCEGDPRVSADCEEAGSAVERGQRHEQRQRHR